MCVLTRSVVSHSCDPVDCSPPGSSVRGSLQTRTLEWVAIPFIQGILPTQGLNPRLLQWQVDSLPLSHREVLLSPFFKSLLCARISLGWIKQKTFLRFRPKPMRCKDRELKTCRARLKTPSPARDQEDIDSRARQPHVSCPAQGLEPRPRLSQTALELCGTPLG